jgi:hypothetical protein
MFDHRDYQDTIEYFRESIRSFDYNRIFNQIVSNRAHLSSSVSQLIHTNDDTESGSSAEESGEPLSPSSLLSRPRSPISTTTTSDSNSSSTSSLSSLLVQGSIAAEAATTCIGLPVGATPSSNRELVYKKKTTAQYHKSYLRIIYDWLKGLYFMQARVNLNVCSKSTGSMQTLIGNASFSNLLQRV